MDHFRKVKYLLPKSVSLLTVVLLILNRTFVHLFKQGLFKSGYKDIMKTHGIYIICSYHTIQKVSQQTFKLRRPISIIILSSTRVKVDRFAPNSKVLKDSIVFGDLN